MNSLSSYGTNPPDFFQRLLNYKIVAKYTRSRISLLCNKDFLFRFGNLNKKYPSDPFVVQMEVLFKVEADASAGIHRSHFAH